MVFLITKIILNYFFCIKKNNKKLFKSFTYESMGGGFIKVNKKNIIIEGFSNAYGYAPHSITAKILKF